MHLPINRIREYTRKIPYWRDKKQLKESGFSYKLVATKFKVTQNGLVLINLSTYNEYAKKLGYEIEKLTNENESIAILPKKNHKSAEDQKTFELKHGELEVPLSVQKQFISQNSPRFIHLLLSLMLFTVKS